MIRTSVCSHKPATSRSLVISSFPLFSEISTAFSDITESWRSVWHDEQFITPWPLIQDIFRKLIAVMFDSPRLPSHETVLLFSFRYSGERNVCASVCWLRPQGERIRCIIVATTWREFVVLDLHHSYLFSWPAHPSYPQLYLPNPAVILPSSWAAQLEFRWP